MKNNEYEELILELQDFYNRIVDETIEVMNTYNCKTPLEIFCLFNVINSYYVDSMELWQITHEKKHSPIYLDDLDCGKIRGLQSVFNGGVCRHRVAMLNDIYTKMGIDSVQVNGYLEMLLNFYYGNSQKKQFADQIFVSKMLDMISRGSKLSDFKGQLKKRKISYQMQDIHDDYSKYYRLPNHVIIMAGNDLRYYLDPMNDVTYYKDDQDNHTIKSSKGLYFFFNMEMNRLLWFCDKKDNGLDIEYTYNRILDRKGASEVDSTNKMKEIYSYLNNYKKGIEEFVNSHHEDIQLMRSKGLSTNKYLI